MKLKNVLIAVSDIDRSIAFYKTLFGLDVLLYSEGNAILTEGLVLQDADIWKTALAKDILPENHASELYFEEPDLEGFLKKLSEWEAPIRFVTPLQEPYPGRKLIRVYDPDGNLIEVATPA